MESGDCPHLFSEYFHANFANIFIYDIYIVSGMGSVEQEKKEIKKKVVAF